MSQNEIVIATVHGTEIRYDPEKKQFFAQVGGRDIRKSSQREIEKLITRMKGGLARTKAIILDYGWRQVTVRPIEAVGLRGSRVQYKSGEYLESESVDDVYAFDETLLLRARELQREHDAWLKRWQALLDKARKIDPAALK
jgi:hypothetical protein